MFSIYTSAFLVNKNQFDYSEALTNFCHFAGQDGEVKVAVPFKDEDQTYEALQNWKRDNAGLSANLEVFYANTDRTDPDFDGKLKNFALQECIGPLCIGIDLDERLCFWQRDRWIELGNFLLNSTKSSVLVPSIDLYQDYEHYKGINHKWYLHKRTGLFRGVVNFARLDDGHHDITKSDSCELIDINGDLASSILLCQDYTPEFLKRERIPFVYHIGHVDLENRILRNKNFWKEHWSTEAGKDVFVPTSIEEIEPVSVKAHGLDLWK